MGSRFSPLETTPCKPFQFRGRPGERPQHCHEGVDVESDENKRKGDGYRDAKDDRKDVAWFKNHVAIFVREGCDVDIKERG